MSNLTAKTSKALIVPGLNLDLASLKNDPTADMVIKAEQALNAISVRNSIIDVDEDKEKAEMKRLKEKLAATPVGKRMKQIAEAKKQRMAEKEEIRSGMKYLLKFFADNGIKVNQQKIKAGNGK